MGIIAYGNIFGEVTITDLFGFLCLDVWSSVVGFQTNNNSGHTIMSSTPIQIPHPFIVDVLLQAHDSTTPSASRSSALILGGLNHEDIPKHEDNYWSNGWLKYSRLGRWQGLPGDKAWSLIHQCNIKGTPQLILYSPNLSVVMFKAGGILYYLGDTMENLFALPFNTTVARLLEGLRGDDGVEPLELTQINVNWPPHEVPDYYRRFYHHEKKRGTDRQREQVERGGNPAINLLDMPRGAWGVPVRHNDGVWVITRIEDSEPSDINSEESDDDFDEAGGSGKDEGGKSAEHRHEGAEERHQSDDVEEERPQEDDDDSNSNDGLVIRH